VKYAKEVINLLSSHPGKEFRMGQIIRYIALHAEFSSRRRNAIRQGVRRVIQCLEEEGYIKKRQTCEKSAFYFWD